MKTNPNYLSENREEIHLLHNSMGESFDQIKYAMFISSINLLFPINILSKFFFLEMTSR
jgi:hypothetical protein